MSALQQVAICGLRSRDSPNPADACEGTKPSVRRNVLRAEEDRTGREQAGCHRPRRTRLRSPLTVAAKIKTGSRLLRQMKVFTPLFSALVSSLAAIAAIAAAPLAGASAALAGTGQPTPWQIGLQGSVTPVMDDITRFNTFLFWITTAIAVFVLVLLAIIIVRFNARANPVPSRTTHNTVLEVIWTIVPVVILLLIAVPSFRLLFIQLDVPKPDLTIKATGKQWLWSYSYPDNGNFEFDSTVVADKDLKPDQPRLLTVDNEMVVPVNKIVHVLVTGADVIHSFAVPSFGIRIDAVPGRINDTWFKATREGMYYGQCSELCGVDHAFMPIAVRVVSDQEFTKWAEAAKQKYAAEQPAPPTALAAAGPAQR
jgi:cytochrome c oxidase subunit II